MPLLFCVAKVCQLILTGHIQPHSNEMAKNDLMSVSGSRLVRRGFNGYALEWLHHIQTHELLQVGMISESRILRGVTGMFRIKNNKLLVIIPGLVLATLLSIKASMDKRAHVVDKPAFAFKIKKETETSVGSVSTLTTDVVLAKDLYTQENLLSLFRFYSDKYPDKRKKLRVKVYTDEHRIERGDERTNIYIYNPTNETDKPEPSSESRQVPYDAVFYRQGEGALAGGGENKWFIFSPDLNNPNETKTVVMKGKDPFAFKQIIESWEKEHGPIKTRVRSYRLKDVEPPGTYYSLETPEENPAYWQSVFTIRLDKQIPIPKDQLRIVSDKTAYLFLGWVYAVTIDGGHSWSIWNAEEYFDGCKNCSSVLISDVQINLEGKGEMSLGIAQGEAIDLLILLTEDYGQTWKKK